ncbi:MAG: SUF system NifU family Fe-S cluster assembly protein [Elusimicrobia bacterium]|jgi:nitrogen fixation NifU-like protein|nr:SUF system NifU family Fe-S cluster assembly protein [Elusimicrobiota bacterium]MBK7208274.1 SUF system NifU family Fe-S cluster assembly protein [Elusimicrobiota bacterium]MBK7545035.1 SUF system NifU family Fe-S cluster assembly protein [Elusimicrobiota bacterium]MBK7574554.1 SUF system NifU family Fe-S cluster assembly protein [Elusimicrobiota bacterium]MBK7688078.1 SUF system NifU family Fe-S cluster assembly protein [Elusimicrobiota bacterium]
MTDDLYREVILDHFRHPRNQGALEAPDVKVQGVNPLCGDSLELMFTVKDAKIADIKMTGNGCSISQSSASMMTEALKGKALGESEALAKAFKKMMLENGAAEDLPEDLEELSALEGVQKYPVRVKCALLAWNTLLQGLEEWKGKTK